MTVATLRMELRVIGCSSARDRRRQIQAIMERLHQSFNVSIADADRGASPDESTLLVAAVGRTRREARETLDRVADALGAHPRAEILGHAITEV